MFISYLENTKLKNDKNDNYNCNNDNQDYTVKSYLNNGIFLPDKILFKKFWNFFSIYALD